MSLNIPALATLAAVVLAWAGVWWLRRRETNFSLVALFALLVGIPIGLAAREHVDLIQPIGRIYINVLLAVVAPLIFIAIVASITSLGTLDKLRSIGVRSIFWLMLSNALGVLLALGLGLAFQPGSGLQNTLGAVSAQTIQAQVQDFKEVVVGFFPTNVAESFSSNEIIPIILIALTLSVAYLSLAESVPEKTRVFRDGIEALKLIIFKAVGYVIALTPYAIVALTAHMVGVNTNLGESFWSLVGLLGLVWAACFIHAYAVNGVLLNTFAQVPVVEFFRKIFPAQLTAFTTQSSVGTLPVTTTQLTHKVGVHPEIAHFTAPLGTTVGMPGCAGIWPILIAVWGINAYGIPYSVGDYLVLALLGVFVSVGTAGVPGAATVAAATVLAAAGLPLEFVAVTIPISIIADTARTMNNVTAAAVSATVVARQTGMLDDEIFAGRAVFVEQTQFEDAPIVAQPVSGAGYAAAAAAYAPVPAPPGAAPSHPAPSAAAYSPAQPAPARGETLWPNLAAEGRPVSTQGASEQPGGPRRLAPHAVVTLADDGTVARRPDTDLPALAGAAAPETNGSRA